MTSSSLFLNMLPHRCWNLWKNVRTVFERTGTDSLDQLVVTYLVKNFAWILWNPNVHYRNCKNLLVIPIHSQPNQGHTFRLYLFIFHYLPYAYAEVFQVTSFVQFLYLKFHIHLLSFLCILHFPTILLSTWFQASAVV